MEPLVSPVMSSDEAVAWKARISSCANQLRLLLFEGYERRAWEALGYGTWTDCLKSLAEEYRFSERRLWQLHAANESEQLLNHGSVGAIPERQLRPLAGLPPEQQQEVWHAAVETAPPSGLTAKHVQQTATRVKGSQPTSQEPPPKSPPRKELQDALFYALKVIDDAQAWDLLAMLWFELEEYYHRRPSTESALAVTMAAHNRLLSLFPPAMVEKFQRGPEWHADTPADKICTACSEWEGAGPTEPCATCGQWVHEGSCMEDHVYCTHTHPRRT